MSGVPNFGKPSAVYRNRLARYADEVWLIWSNKWDCWYRDNCQGYTNDIALAGLYGRAEAARHFIGGPKKYRDVEPFPVSCVIGHLRARKAQIVSEAAAMSARIDAAISKLGDGK